MTSAGPPAVAPLVLDELRGTMVELFGAERRLRAREQQKPGSLSSSHLRALSALYRAESVPAGDLARSADLKPASVTAMLDQLEAWGVIERTRVPTDRRVCMVSLTAQGRRLLDDRRRRWEEAWESTFGEEPAEDLVAALRVMRGIIAILDSF